MVKTQVERDREYRRRLKAEDPEAYREYLSRKKYGSVKSYIRLHATDPQLKELDTLISDKLKPWSTINTKREGL